LIAFVSVLFATLTTRYFVTVRGASDGVVLSINLLCVINALQIFLCFLDFFLRFGRGVYSNACIALSYLFGVLWVAVTAFELVIASVELGALRLDLFTIAIGQAASALLAYLFWPSREYFFVQGMTKPKIINERKKRRRTNRRRTHNRTLKYTEPAVASAIARYNGTVAKSVVKKTVMTSTARCV
jgi:hypothetical protein